MDRTVLVVDARYLVQEINNEGKPYGSLLEWECLEVSDFAVKVQNKIKGSNSYSLFNDKPSVNEPFWILKSSISDLGESKYKIIETLKS